MRFVRSLLSLALAVCPSMAWAADPYIGIYGGANFLTDADNSSGPIIAGNPDFSVRSEADTGFVAGGVFGARLQTSTFFDVRLEADMSYRSNEISDLVIDQDGGLGGLLGLGSLNGRSLSDAGLDVEGSASALSGLFNAWIEAPINRLFTPYVGGGIGVAQVSLHDVEAGGVEIVDDSATVFAYQLGAGTRSFLAESTFVSLDYRYFATADPEFEDAAGVDFESEYAAHTLLLSLGYQF